MFTFFRRNAGCLVSFVLLVCGALVLFVPPRVVRAAITQLACFAVPCVVVGPAADGAAAAGAPLIVSGVNGATGFVETLRVDGNGAIALATSNDTAGDGVSNVLRRVAGSAGSGFLGVYSYSIPFMFNGSTWDRQFSCPNSAAVSVAATGPTEIIALTAAQSIRICNFTGSVDAGGMLDVTIVRGTGTNCGTGTATVAGPYDQVTFLNLFSPGAPLTVAAGNAVCLTNSAATALTGAVIYAKF